MKASIRRLRFLSLVLVATGVAVTAGGCHTQTPNEVSAIKSKSDIPWENLKKEERSIFIDTYRCEVGTALVKAALSWEPTGKVLESEALPIRFTEYLNPSRSVSVVLIVHTYSGKVLAAVARNTANRVASIISYNFLVYALDKYGSTFVKDISEQDFETGLMLSDGRYFCIAAVRTER